MHTKKMLKIVHNSIVPNSQKLKVIQMLQSIMDKFWYIHTMKYYKAIKKDELLLYESIWVTCINKMSIKKNDKKKLKNRLLVNSERNQNNSYLWVM